MDEITDFFNTATSCEEICEQFGVDNADGHWSKEFNHPVFKLDESSDTVVKVKFGPAKGFPRTMHKTKRGIEDEKDKGGKPFLGLRDLNHITLEFEDPLLIALYFEVLTKKFKRIVGIKNKFKQKTYVDPPILHMNLDLGEGWLVEAQMHFRDILQIKKE